MWVERIVGLEDMKVTVAMLTTPEDDVNTELVKFHKPVDKNGVQPSMANHLVCGIFALRWMMSTPL